MTPPPHQPSALQHILEVPLRRPWHLAIPFVLVVIGAVTASFVVEKRYRSATLILLESDKIPESVARVSDPAEAGGLSSIKTEILARTRLEKVVKELDPYLGSEGQSLSESVEELRADTTINVKGRDAFAIEFVHTDPEKAMQVANRLATLFIEEVSLERESEVEGAYEFIESQLEEARKELELKEAAVRKFKESHMGNLPEQMSANLATLQRLQLEQQSLSLNLRAAKDREVVLETSLAEQARAAATGTVISLDPSTELEQLRAQLVTLRSRYTDAHPDVQRAAARMARLESILAERSTLGRPVPVDRATAAARSQLEQTRLEVRQLEVKRAELEQQIASFQARVEIAPRTEQELGTLTRDQNKLNENYLQLLNKKMEAQMAERLERRWKGQRFRILDPAHLPDIHYYPDRGIFLLAGLVGGLILGACVSYGAELLDDSVKGETQIQDVIPFPVLAVIPRVEAQRAGSMR
jgi:polysaccharide biosynthesis transport protein